MLKFSANTSFSSNKQTDNQTMIPIKISVLLTLFVFGSFFRMPAVILVSDVFNRSFELTERFDIICRVWLNICFVFGVCD